MKHQDQEMSHPTDAPELTSTTNGEDGQNQHEGMMNEGTHNVDGLVCQETTDTQFGNNMRTNVGTGGEVMATTEAVVTAAAQEVAMQVVHDTMEGGVDGNPDSAENDSGDGVGSSSEPPQKKRRLCRHPGCTKVIKSQGMCQRHGAKAKRCKVDGCEKQAQGTHQGMCKRHWKESNHPNDLSRARAPGGRPNSILPPEPEGDSVYENVLPQSISYKPSSLQTSKPTLIRPEDDPLNPPRAPEGVGVMPLVAFLRDGMGNEAGWHRNAERRARGVYPVDHLGTQMEPWERQLAMVEILLLSGGTPHANFYDLAHAWGREKGFHLSLATNVCERRGDLERKTRSDAGRVRAGRRLNSFGDDEEQTRVLDTVSAGVATAAAVEAAQNMLIHAANENMTEEEYNDAVTTTQI